jgi:hypothetical protein
MSEVKAYNLPDQIDGPNGYVLDLSVYFESVGYYHVPQFNYVCQESGDRFETTDSSQHNHDLMQNFNKALDE